MRYWLLFILALPIVGCSSPSKSSSEDGGVAKPGTILGMATLPTADTLNHLNFSVSLIADSVKGTYQVVGIYGYDTARGGFTMPKGAEDCWPSIRKSTAPETFIIGFLLPGDTTFYDYFQVSGRKGAVAMEYTKAYTF